MSLAYALTYFCDVMLYFTAMGCFGLMRGCGPWVDGTPAVLAAGCWLAGRMMGKGRLRWLALIAYLPALLMCRNAAGVLIALPPMAYLALYIHNNRRAPDYYYTADRFRASLCIVGVILLLATMFHARTWKRGLPFLFLFFTLSMALLRLLRHDDRVARSRRFRVLNLVGVATVCAVGFALSQPGIIDALQRAWLWFADHILLNVLALALYLLQWVLYALSWLVMRLLGNPEMDAADLSGMRVDGARGPMLPQAAVAVRELPMLARLLVQGAGIAALAALAFVVLRALSRHVARSDSSGGNDERESLDEPHPPRPPRLSLHRRDPEDGVRRQYRRALMALRARNGHVAPTMNTLQIEQANARLTDPEALSELRAIYLPVRYGDHPAAPENLARARQMAERIRKR